MAGRAITIGNFDGVHLGHRALVASARAAVGADGSVTVVTFDPPPAVVLGRADRPERLALLDRRVSLLRDAGADNVVVCRVDRALLAQSAEAFLDSTVMPLQPTVVVEGPDFHFGRGRSGDNDTLAAYGRRHGFDVQVVEPVVEVLSDLRRVPVRSSVIRWLLERGRVSEAERLLGRPWLIEGAVVPGDRRGRDIGCPTANLDHGELVLPADGVYAGRARCEAGVFAAAVSIGRKPTFDLTPRVLEAHLLDWDGPVDAYGWHLEIEFMGWIRDQVKYGDVRSLMDQITRDLDATRSLVSPSSR